MKLFDVNLPNAEQWIPDVDLVCSVMNILKTPKYFLAGGYFRDIHNGRPWKDIDVFIPDTMPLDTGDEALRYDLDNVTMVKLGQIEVNLIGMKRNHTLSSILERMDIGLCQIGMTHTGSIKATENYLRDVEGKTITVLFQPKTAADYDHIARVQVKYPDHKVVHAWEQGSFNF